MPFGGTVSADDYYAGTRAAVCGGTTTVFDFALQDFGENMVDTIKRREGDRVTETVDRESLAAVQTPQVFEASLLKAALQSAMEAGAALTDDCSAVERLGKIVYLVEGDPENLKITTPLDLVLAEAILEDRRRRA